MSALFNELRKIRIGKYAAIDALGTIAIAVVWSRQTGQDVLISIAYFIAAGDVVHRLSGTRTPGSVP
jgi:threonine/homoserine efflux transporter RhtA